MHRIRIGLHTLQPFHLFKRLDVPAKMLYPSITNNARASPCQITQRIQICSRPLRMGFTMSRLLQSDEPLSLGSLLMLDMVLSLTTKSLRPMPLNQNQICYGAAFDVS